MTDPDHEQQKVLDAADEPKGDYPCPQCGERRFDLKMMRFCFYCENRFCPHCRKRDSAPVTGETVDICSTCAERIQELADQERKIRQQAAEIERLKEENRRIPVSERLPEEYKVVLVAGGIAKFINGSWWSGMEEPLYSRRIEWEVTWWKPITLSDQP